MVIIATPNGPGWVSIDSAKMLIKTQPRGRIDYWQMHWHARLTIIASIIADILKSLSIKTNTLGGQRYLYLTLLLQLFVNLPLPQYQALVTKDSFKFPLQGFFIFINFTIWIIWLIHPNNRTILRGWLIQSTSQRRIEPTENKPTRFVKYLMQLLVFTISSSEPK